MRVIMPFLHQVEDPMRSDLAREFLAAFHGKANR